MEVALYVVEDATNMDLPGIIHHHLGRGGVTLHKVGLLNKSLRIIDSVDFLDPALRQVKLSQDVTASGQYRTGDRHS
jgi:hypothetical protein